MNIWFGRLFISIGIHVSIVFYSVVSVLLKVNRNTNQNVLFIYSFFEESTSTIEQLQVPTTCCGHLVSGNDQIEMPMSHGGYFGLSTSHLGGKFQSLSESGVWV